MLAGKPRTKVQKTGGMGIIKFIDLHPSAVLKK